MLVPDDLELLRRFARNGEQAAFTQLVSRHVDLVYSAALRQVRDPATAEDVTQAVFIALAAKAAAIRPTTIVAGWLLLTTRYAANDALRASRRRSRHEWVAARLRTADMHRRQGTSSASQAAADRDEQLRLEAVLDAALANLGASGRDAVVLRFFEGNSLADVGRRLGISEEAAKKRVGRSLLQLRKLLLRHGITLGPEGIGSALGAVAIRPAPAALAARAAHAALASMPASMVKGAFTIMAWTKAKTAAIAAAALLLAGGGATVGWRLWNGGNSGATQTIVLPPGQIAPAMRFTWQEPEQPDGDKTYHGPPVAGIVRTANGKPVAGATVMLSTWTNDVILHPTPRAKPAPTTQTAPDGRFEFQPKTIPYGVVATCDQGIGVITVAKLRAAGALVIEPWGRVDGAARLGSKPLGRSQVTLWYQNSTEAEAARVDYNGFPRLVVTDESGHFVLDRLPPGLVDVTCQLPGGVRAQHSPQFHIQSGATTYIVAGGTGRPIIGRVNPPPREGNDHIVRLERLMPEPFASLDWDHLTPERRAQVMAELEASPEFPAWEGDRNQFQTQISPDGTFRLEDVPAGRYAMRVAYWNLSKTSRYLEEIADLKRTLTVDPMPGGRSDDPLDLGNIELHLRTRLKPGEPAPELTWRGADGKPASLQSLRGKYVLGIVLRNADASDDMWEDLLKLKPLYDRFGADPRLVMLGLYAGPGFDAARQSATNGGVAWPLVNVGQSLDSVPEPYRSSGEMMFVIDPQGAVLAKDLAPQRAWYVLDQVLSHGTPADDRANVNIRHIDLGQDPRPALQQSGDNAAAHATLTIVDGIPAKTPPGVLIGGTLPGSDDAPAQNFCFESGTFEGRLKIDLGRPIAIQQITTLSRHKSERAPQVYVLYASDGGRPNFDPAPAIGLDPAAHGWTRLAAVDTRPATAPRGGTYAATLTPAGVWPRYRYLLFEMFPTETVDAFGNTFYSQVHVTETSGPTAASTR